MPEEERQVAITRTDKGTGTGRVVFAPCPDQPPPPEATPMFLHSSVSQWLEQNPTIDVREMLGLVQDGNTVGIHAWFDCPTTIDAANRNAVLNMTRTPCCEKRETNRRMS